MLDIPFSGTNKTLCHIPLTLLNQECSEGSCFLTVVPLILSHNDQNPRCKTESRHACKSSLDLSHQHTGPRGTDGLASHTPFGLVHCTGQSGDRAPEDETTRSSRWSNTDIVAHMHPWPNVTVKPIHLKVIQMVTLPSNTHTRTQSTQKKCFVPQSSQDGDNHRELLMIRVVATRPDS